MRRKMFRVYDGRGLGPSVSFPGTLAVYGLDRNGYLGSGVLWTARSPEEVVLKAAALGLGAQDFEKAVWKLRDGVEGDFAQWAPSDEEIPFGH